MTRETYTAVAIILHWAIAAMLLFNIPLGWWMHDAIESPATAARAIVGYQMHKSIGLTVLALSALRLAWRFAYTPPPLPAHMPAWEKIAAKAAHWGLYILMFAAPLTGWIYVSTGWSHGEDRPLNVPTLFFNLFEVPHIYGLNQTPDAVRAGMAGASFAVHEKLAWAVIVLAGLHAAAALKHWLIDRDAILPQMLPGLPALNAEAAPPRASPKRRAALIGGALAIVLFFAIVFQFLLAAPLGAPAAAAPEAAQTQESAAPPASPPPGEAAPASAAPAQGAALWRVDPAASAIRFSGAHAGVPFQGRFTRWRADIRFSPDDLAHSSALVTIEAASARDGVALHEQTLPQAEWLDAAAHPAIRFHAARFRHRGGNAYEADGEVTLKGRAHALALPFTLTIQGDRAVMDARVSLDRAAYDLGQQSDADGEYVSRAIGVAVHVEAVRAS
ncbi:MAG: cytochrome b/b6 domain-containing protein [Hyphomonadaceae bacterium]